jgi:hypothetical protein
MYYQGAAGLVDDQPLLTDAIESWYTVTSTYPSVIVFSGLVCLGSTFYPPPGTNLVGSTYEYSRYGGSDTDGPAFVGTGAVIAPFQAMDGAPLIQLGVLTEGWTGGSDQGDWAGGPFKPTGQNPTVSNLAFSGWLLGVPTNGSMPGLVAINVQDVGDGRIEDCTFAGFDRLGSGYGSPLIIGGGILIQSSGDTSPQGFYSNGWHFNSVQFDHCAYGIMFLGPNSTDSQISNVHTGDCFFPIVLGLSSSDNAGGALISDCHFVGNTGSTIISSGQSVDPDVATWTSATHVLYLDSSTNMKEFALATSQTQTSLDRCCVIVETPHPPTR